MRRAIMLMLAMLLLGAALSFSQEVRREGRYYVAEITRSFTVQPGGQLRISRIRGDVDVRSWQKKEVFIRQSLRLDVYTEGEAKRALEETQSGFNQVGDIIEVVGEGGREWIQSHFYINTPADFRIDVSTSGGDVSVRELNGEMSLGTAGGDIELVTVGGPLRASTSGGDITVRMASGDAELRTAGGDLILENILGMLRASTSGGNITLLGARKDVEVRTSGGDIDIREVSGRVEASTSGGDIVVEQCSGEAVVRTSGGDIIVRNSGGDTHASTSGGDIEVYNINGSVEARTSGGDLELRDIHGALDGATSGGDITAAVTLTDFSKAHAITLRSSGGSIELSIPEKMPATVRAEITIEQRGWGSFERYEILSDFPLTMSRDKTAGREIVRAEGKLNGGGDLIDLRTSNGNIQIRKLRSL